MANFTHLELYNFRNWATLSFSPAPSTHLITGANGSGKTNILESLFYAVMAKSFRHARLRDMVKQGETEFAVRLEAESHGNPHHLKVSGTVADHSFALDNHRIQSVSELIGRFPIMVFSPDDLIIASGPPAERRRFLNMLLSQCSPVYFRSLIAYNRTLLQRNAALKLSSTPADYLAVLTETLIQEGAVLRRERHQCAEELQAIASLKLSRVSGETMTLSYNAHSEESENDEITILKEQAARCSREEREERTTLFGPHTDDMRLAIDEKDARKFSSRGQIRSAVLSLKMASVELLEKACNESCILLLDDLFSELDDKRSHEILQALPEGRQTLVAVPTAPEWLKELAHQRTDIEELF